MKKNNKKTKKSEEKVGKKTEKRSSIAEFVKRPLPTDNEMKRFEDYLTDQMERDNQKGGGFADKEEREGDINDSLTEIYKDSKGNPVDVDKLEIKKGRGIIFWFFSLLFFVLFCLGAGMYGYYYMFNTGSGLEEVDIKIEAEESVLANEVFTYNIICENRSRVPLKDARLDINYPDNFILLNSSKEPDEGDNSWSFDNIPAGEDKKISIEGKIIDKKNSSNVLLATMNYIPENFSSEFKKEDSSNLKIKETGINIAVEHPSDVLVGEEEVISFDLEPQKENFIDEFQIKGNIPDNMEILDTSLSGNQTEGAEESSGKVEEIEKGRWKIKELGDGEHKLDIKFRFNEKASGTEDIDFDIIKQEENRDHIFDTKEFFIKVLESDLELNMIIEGEKDDQAVDFGQKLNYSITYANRGESTMKNVLIMAVLENGFLDWTTLKDGNNGEEKGNTITWSGEEVPKLEKLEPGQEGSIDFSLNVVDFREEMLEKKNFQIRSYAQYEIKGDKESSITIEDNKSNEIINKINSDVNISEEIRYFDESNMPVGSGPLPPRVGEKTEFKVYWTVTNNLHNLIDGKVEMELPDHIEWEGKSRASAGNIDYKEEEGKVVWNIGKMPTTVYRLDGQFNISLTPKKEDIDKIMVLSSGAEISAKDENTEAIIEKKEEPATTKLKDDDIADMNSDGRVVE
ncbi:MAG: hypothetical protein ACOCVY_00225 [Patescibacteria group bacterium]